MMRTSPQVLGSSGTVPECLFALPIAGYSVDFGSKEEEKEKEKDP